MTMHKTDCVQDTVAITSGKESDFAGRLKMLTQVAASRAAFARIIGISPITLWTYLGPKQSTPSLPMIRKIAARLGIDPNWLAFGQGRAPSVVKVAERIAGRLAAERQSENRSVA